jgi:hypothetical protein
MQSCAIENAILRPSRYNRTFFEEAIPVKDSQQNFFYVLVAESGMTWPVPKKEESHAKQTSPRLRQPRTPRRKVSD